MRAKRRFAPRNDTHSTKTMKKLLFIIFLILFSNSVFFANSDSFFTTEISLGTGISIYDSNTGDSRKSLLNTSDFKRIIIGLTADTNLNISAPLKIMFGAETFCDFLWAGSDYFNTFDYAFFTGIKVFPTRTGFNFSISYVLGNRTDYFDEAPKQDTKAWGNGFRISLQYDFMEEKEYKIKPHAGAYYRCVPRGNYNTDHILCLYGGIRF